MNQKDKTIQKPAPVELEKVLEINTGSPIGQCRTVPVSLGDGKPKAILAVYCADFDVDPYVEMFFFPSDTLKMILFTEEGEVLWKKDLGPAVVPGLWFCPVLAFDLDGDGRDEIWFVNNVDPKHPLGLSNYRLERLDALTGETTGQWVWPSKGRAQSLSHTFRNFIVGGAVRGEPVLVTVQGTYGDMFFQAWNQDMSLRWELCVGEKDSGARGSHMCPVVDINRDGVDELMWGERCIELDTGRELFCADRDSFHGHSDVIQPVYDWENNKWFLYSCREDHSNAAPRVNLYDGSGNHMWGHVERGHMDMGWVARLGEGRKPVAMAIRIGHKTCGPDGRFHQDRTEFVFDLYTGEPYELPFSVYQTLPVDINGDGYSELIRGVSGGDGTILDRFGNNLGCVGGTVGMILKFMDLPGEQILSYYPDGTIKVWRDKNARDSEAALARYAHPFYRTCSKLMAVGYNLNVLGGI